MACGHIPSDGQAASKAFAQLYEPQRDNERPRDHLDNWSYANFMALADNVRDRCLAALRGWIPDDMLATWQDQYRRGMVIGSDLLGFHFLSGGMQIRNRLRTVLLDAELPEVIYPLAEHHEGPSSNWDDYYSGVLRELVRLSIEPDTSPILDARGRVIGHRLLDNQPFRDRAADDFDTIRANQDRIKRGD